MRYLDKMLLIYLSQSKLKMEITGMDMKGFEKVLYHKEKCCLEMIESIVFIDDDLMTDTEKIESIKRMYQNDFGDEE